jgi:hypothetical protein
MVAGLLLAAGAWAIVSFVLAGRQGAPALSQGFAPLPVALAQDDATSSPSTVDPPRAADDGDPVVSYRIEARLDEERHRVHATSVVTWRNRSRVPQTELYLHLYLNGFKNERSVFMRSTASGGFRGSGRPWHWGWIELERFYVRELERDLWRDAERHTPGDPNDETDIRIALPQSVAPGESLTIEMAWTAQLPNVTLRTGFAGSFHMVAQWFPKLARLEPDGTWSHFPFQRLSEFYADFGDYDVRLDTPASFVVGATGVPEGVAEPHGERTTRRYLARRVHDFAFTAWDRFRERTRDMERGVQVRILYPPGYDEAAETELDAVARGLRFFGEAFGEYPYPLLTVVHPPREASEAGGMEYPTLITTGGDWYLPHLGVRYLEHVTVHELGHQWFYGLVASNENRWPFLDEGLTTWAELCVMEAWFPRSSGGAALGLSVGLDAVNRAGAVGAWRHGPIAQPADAFASGSDYGSLVYSRTATLIETIARVHGGGCVMTGLGRYAREQRFAHPTPDDLVAALGASCGDAAARQLRIGLFEEGWIDYAVSGFHSEPARPAAGVFGDPLAPDAAPPSDAAAYVGVVKLRRHGNLRFPVVVELVARDGSAQRVRWQGDGRATVIDYRGSAELVAVVVDPDHEVLIDDELGNNVMRRGAQGGAPRVRNLATFLAQLGLSIIAP